MSASLLALLDAPSHFYDLSTDSLLEHDDDFFEQEHPLHEPDEPPCPPRSLIDELNEDGAGGSMPMPDFLEAELPAPRVAAPCPENRHSPKGSGVRDVDSSQKKRSLTSAGLQTPDDRQAEISARGRRLLSPGAASVQQQGRRRGSSRAPETLVSIDHEDASDLIAELKVCSRVIERSCLGLHTLLLVLVCSCTMSGSLRRGSKLRVSV